MTAAPIDRRTLIAGTLAAAPVYALLSMLATTPLALDRRVSARTWIRRQDEIATALATGEIPGPAWQDAVLELATEVDLAALSAEIERAKIRTLGRGLSSYPVKQSVAFVDEQGAPRDVRFAAALFRFDRNNVITPHAHRHMVSAHMVLDGAFRVRTFDRVRDEPGALVIRPTSDEEIGVGTVSTMSDARDNVHWFVPLRDRSTTFDIIVSGLDAGEPNHRIEAIDPVRGDTLADGSLRAPLIGFAEAARRYTPEV